MCYWHSVLPHAVPHVACVCKSSGSEQDDERRRVRRGKKTTLSRKYTLPPKNNELQNVHFSILKDQGNLSKCFFIPLVDSPAELCDNMLLFECFYPV